MDIIEHFQCFIAQRSGIDSRDYSDRDSFLADYRRIRRDGNDARIMLRGWAPADELTAIVTGSGRLRLGAAGLEYVAGQYFATEYRAAACCAIAEAWASHWRNGARARNIPLNREGIVTVARKHFGRAIANRWFK